MVYFFVFCLVLSISHLQGDACKSNVNDDRVYNAFPSVWWLQCHLFYWGKKINSCFPWVTACWSSSILQFRCSVSLSLTARRRFSSFLVVGPRFEGIPCPFPPIFLPTLAKLSTDTGARPQDSRLMNVVSLVFFHLRVMHLPGKINNCSSRLRPRCSAGCLARVWPHEHVPSLCCFGGEGSPQGSQERKQAC